MKQIILSQNIVNSRNILSPSALITNDAIYIVRHDFEVVEPVSLPLGCELRIEGGSIKASGTTKDDNDHTIVKGKIYMTPVPENSSRNTEHYSLLTIASTANESISGNSIEYTPNEEIFLADGCYLKSTTGYHFEIYVNTPCRIMLPQLKDSRRGTLHIKSDKVNSIQIDGKCDFQIHAENCKFQRIFACKWGWCTINRLAHNIDYSIFENCEIWANDYPLPLSTIPHNNSNFLSLSAGVIKDELSGVESHRASSEVLNWLIIKDSVISNLGINGNINVNNCTFLFGSNCNDNYETIHCGSHSRITNCLFDGRQKSGQAVPNLTADVIDVYNGHDIIIDGCTFIDFQADKVAPGRNMITVKSHYFDPVNSGVSDNTSDVIGVQNGTIIRNCYFDLSDYIGGIIEVWNGVYGNIVEHRELNRQFTLVDANYIYAPNASNFVNCFGFTDYLTVSNNVGQVQQLVFVNDNYPNVNNNPIEGDDKNMVHNLVIDNNTLRVQYYKPIDWNNPNTSQNQKNTGMNILWGTHIDNLELTNNKVEGYIWGGLNNDSVLNLSGTIRICNNESVKRGDGYAEYGLFQNLGMGAIVMPEDLNVFSSGNISNGHKTDVGPMSVADSEADGIKSIGRQFFCTQGTYRNKLLIFNGRSWLTIIQ